MKNMLSEYLERCSFKSKHYCYACGEEVAEKENGSYRCRKCGHARINTSRFTTVCEGKADSPFFRLEMSRLKDGVRGFKRMLNSIEGD